MDLSIEELFDSTDLAQCAKMMMGANPWNKLFFTTEQCEESLADPGMRIHGAYTADRELVGFLASLASGLAGEPMIEYLCVGPTWRGHGIGSMLISFFEDVLFPEADNMYLFVSDINPDAIRLYVRLGYNMIGALPNYNLVGQTEFLHRKTRRPRQAANAGAA